MRLRSLVSKTIQKRRLRDVALFRRGFLGLALSIGMVLPAQALQCVGALQYLAVEGTGALHVDVGYGVWRLCHLETPLSSGGQTVALSACKAWYAALLKQHATGGQVRIYFNTYTDCAAIGSWVTPVPLAFHMDVL